MFWDETHEALHQSAGRWVERHITPHAARWEEEGIFSADLYREAGTAGLLGAAWPEALGGGGGDVHHGLIVAEAFIRGTSVGTAVGLGSHSIALPPIAALGTPEQQARWIPPVLAGERIAALAISEAGAGSDVARLRCRAVRDGDHYVLDGAKMFITSGARADLVTVAVRTGEEGYGGISLLVVERGTPGFRVGRPLQKMGWWASDTAELIFEGCRVPVANRLGEENAGFYGIMANFTAERLLLAATATAIARLALELSQRYVREREAFGRPLWGFQVTRHRLAEMATAEASARAFVSVVAEQSRRGEDVTSAVAMAKNAAAEACSFVTDRAVQLHGGAGYLRESVVERLYRDARLFSIGGGTTEIMNEIIARRMDD